MSEQSHGDALRQLSSLVDELETAGHDVQDAGVSHPHDADEPAAEVTVLLDDTAGTDTAPAGLLATTDHAPDTDTDLEPEPEPEPEPDADEAVDGDADEDGDEDADGEPDATVPAAAEDVFLAQLEAVGNAIATRLQGAGYETVVDVHDASVSELTDVRYVGAERAHDAKAAVDEFVDAGAPDSLLVDDPIDDLKPEGGDADGDTDSEAAGDAGDEPAEPATSGPTAGPDADADAGDVKDDGERVETDGRGIPRFRQEGITDDEMEEALAGATCARDVAAELGIPDPGTAAAIVDDLGLLEDLKAAGQMDRADAAAAVSGVVESA